MSCAYQRAAQRVAAMTGLSYSLVSAAMDIARKRTITVPTPDPDALPSIVIALGLPETCKNPVLVIRRVWAALLVLMHTHSTDLRIQRWRAVAAILGVPAHLLPEPAHAVVVETVRQQWALLDLPLTDDRAVMGIRALHNSTPISTKPIDEAIGAGDRHTIVTWIAHGVWDDRFEAVCHTLTDMEIETIVQTGVAPNAIVARVAQRWRSDTLPWDVLPLALWDQVTDTMVAREGRARTAAMRLIRHPTLRSDRLITAAAQQEHWAAEVLIARPDLRTDDRLIASVAHARYWAALVLQATDCCDNRLIEAVANQEPWHAKNILINRPDLSDDRLITTAASDPACARDVLVARHDLSDPRLIAAVATDPRLAAKVLIARPDLSDDRLIAAVAERGTPWDGYAVLIARHDLSDDRLIAAVATDPRLAAQVLIACPDLRTNARLLTAIAQDQHLIHDVVAQCPDLRDHPLLRTTVKRNRSSTPRT